MKRKLLVLALASVLSAAQAQITNTQQSILAPAVQTSAQVNSLDQVNQYYRGLHLVVTVTGYVSGSYTLTLQGKNLNTGNYYDLLVGTAINANGQMILKLYPGIPGSVGGAASDFLPQIWRVQLNGTGSPNMTIAVDAMLAGG